MVDSMINNYIHILIIIAAGEQANSEWVKDFMASSYIHAKYISARYVPLIDQSRNFMSIQADYQLK